ncbi:hypothetical protein [Rhizobium leguminosarum]|uniref:hypothetical protein n=1 Tax=Rhizobium leguminosarum TaxID=384 RepID=UPI0014426991|nr:hypothetical protein [Rhizobium leguminosarum]NKK67524.1 hypothetical protein [Rhizobium leguminosarum bv. viciae]NKK76455.1 hypothetical protein [Rhizobium leguminosarum bv. viciae]
MAFFEPMRHTLIVKPLAPAYRGIHAVTWRGEGRHPKIAAVFDQLVRNALGDLIGAFRPNTLLA